MKWTLLFALLFLVVSGYFIFILNELRHIVNQLTYITEHETNAELTSTSKNKLIKHLLSKNNLLIKKNKSFYQQQRQKEKEVQKILTNLTHDLKTPLTVSSGYTQLLLKEIEREEHKEILGKIDTSLMDISHYLSYLMEYNLIQEKTIKLNLEIVDVSEFLQENLFTYYEEFEKQQIHLDLQIQEHQKLLLDVSVFQRLIQNILGNILKHGKDYAHIVLENNGDDIQIRFSNGLLKPVENVQIFFDRFFTEDLSRSNKSTGLGLSIIKELASLLHSEVTLHAENNEFHLVLTLKNHSEKSFGL
ncbi:sensor histidine kinase [Enterococcus crotali]|uniref:sensor histidine kinase n=1 Tax=Enterococcus crotali TaxID=1453587 RepID=UPI000470E016|nr:HAMP domain-containing sensor histidine kinase [Enterococcus crotali]